MLRGWKEKRFVWIDTDSDKDWYKNFEQKQIGLKTII